MKGKRTRSTSRARARVNRKTSADPARLLDEELVSHQNDQVIAYAEGHPAESATRTILIVDDDRSVADTFSRMLKLEGFNVAAALGAEAGLELADNIRPQAIILDMRMPITNGLQFLRTIRTKPHLIDVPVAIVTVDYFLPDPVQMELKALGASIRFKPLWIEDLIALARTLVSALTTDSYAPAGGSRWTRRRCGSCGRPGVTWRTIARSAY